MMSLVKEILNFILYSGVTPITAVPGFLFFKAVILLKYKYNISKQCQEVGLCMHENYTKEIKQCFTDTCQSSLQKQQIKCEKPTSARSRVLFCGSRSATAAEQVRESSQCEGNTSWQRENDQKYPLKRPSLQYELSPIQHLGGRIILLLNNLQVALSSRVSETSTGTMWKPHWCNYG